MHMAAMASNRSGFCVSRLREVVSMALQETSLVGSSNGRKIKAPRRAGADGKCRLQYSTVQ